MAVNYKEILDLLQEECAETIQAASKIKRFGLRSHNPYAPEKNNTVLLEDEIGDTILLIKILEEMKIIDMKNIENRMIWKRTKLIERGIIDE